MSTTVSFMFFLSFFFLSQQVSAQQADLWPYPSSIIRGPNALTAILVEEDDDFKINTVATKLTASDKALLQRAASRFIENMYVIEELNVEAWRYNIFENLTNFTEPAAPSSTLTTLTITVHGASVPLAHGVDESYTLAVSINVNSPGVTTAQITANTLWGALWGLETMTQVVMWEPELGYIIPYLPITITDAPRFGWRGLMVDVASHYLPPPAIEAILDVMSATKLNVLHFHISDAESFPYVSKSYPLASKKGAYDPGAIYDVTELQEIIAYATDRGVRVVVELDTPGYTASWGQGYPSVVADCWDWVRQTYGYIGFPSWDNVALDVTNPNATAMTKGLLKELADIFPDKYIHVGGDEVNLGCWMSVPHMMTYCQTHGCATFNSSTGQWEYQMEKLESNWTQMLVSYVNSLGKRPIVWEEQFTDGVPLAPNVVVNAWYQSSTVRAAAAAGYDVITSVNYNLELASPTCPWNATVCPVNYMYVLTWKDMYDVDPLAGITNATQAAHVLGGEMSALGDSTDSTNVQDRIWQRGLAVAERLWSPAYINSTFLAQPRLSSFRCKLAWRKMAVGPTEPAFCGATDLEAVIAAGSRSKANPYQAVAAISIVINVLLAIVLCGPPLYRKFFRSRHDQIQNLSSQMAQ